MEAQQEERQLTWGKKLAHNGATPCQPPVRRACSVPDRKVRDKTVKVLRLWLSKQPSLSELEVLKLWKGLFYCECTPRHMIVC